MNKLVFQKFPQMSPWYVRPIIQSFASSVDKMWLNKQLTTHLGMVRPSTQLFEVRLILFSARANVVHCNSLDTDRRSIQEVDFWLDCRWT